MNKANCYERSNNTSENVVVILLIHTTNNEICTRNPIPC